MANINTEKNDNIDSSNIFDEFIDDSALIDEVAKTKKDINKDKFYYLKKAWLFLQSLFIILIVVSLLLYWYIYIQKNENLSNSKILDPFCYIILWNITKNETYCSSLWYLKVFYTNDIKELKEKNTKKIIEILEKLYEVENFNKTKEVIFLLDKSETKLKIISILKEFDNLKNTFDKIDKQKVQCNNLELDSKNNLLSMTCNAYSAGYEKWLRWVDWTNDITLKWSSISVANSFINFIEQKSDLFNVIDRQKVFKSEITLWEKTDFTNRTTFNLKLKYNLK